MTVLETLEEDIRYLEAKLALCLGRGTGRLEEELRLLREAERLVLPVRTRFERLVDD